MWDDTSPRWRNTSLVTVRDRPIALRYLHQYYRNFRHGRKIWDGLKHNWHIWKVSSLLSNYSGVNVSPIYLDAGQRVWLIQ